MEKTKLIDMAIERLIGDMDDLEGNSALQHSRDECPNPLTCDMHDDETAEALGKDGGESPAMSTVDGELVEPPVEGKGVEDRLTPEEIEGLRKLIH